MIYYVKGKLVSKSPARIVIESCGIGYALNVSLETSRIIGEEGQQVQVFTCMKIRDEEVELYGFASTGEMDIFNLLLSVPGVGPKMAVRILSGATADELYHAIISEDAAFFTGVPGIGKKTGERLIVELKQKVEKLQVPEIKAGGEDREIITGAIEALTVLGYKRRDAAVVVGRIVKESGGGMAIEDIIRQALKRG